MMLRDVDERRIVGSGKLEVNEYNSMKNQRRKARLTLAASTTSEVLM